jgi:hypothetical protein
VCLNCVGREQNQAGREQGCVTDASMYADPDPDGTALALILIPDSTVGALPPMYADLNERDHSLHFQMRRERGFGAHTSMLFSINGAPIPAPFLRNAVQCPQHSHNLTSCLKSARTCSP